LEQSSFSITRILFSKSLKRLEFDRSYPKSPSTLGEYIRKWRMDKGILQVDLARKLGVNEMTIVIRR